MNSSTKETSSVSTPLIFTYRNWRNEVAERAVMPIRLFFGSTAWHPEAQWLLEAIDLDRNESRTFAVRYMRFAESGDYQRRVGAWMLACFGEAISRDLTERNHRFLEEAIELVQSTGCTRSEAHQLVDYVFDRPVGDPHQETGGVMVTLAAFCTAADLDMVDAGEDELARIWTKVEAIRAKQAAKPKHSPLPGPSAPGGSA